MNELARPFLKAWDYVGNVGGFPGQVFFVIACVMLVIGALTWFNNRK